MNKRILAILLGGCLILSLSGCGKKPTPEMPEEPPVVEEPEIPIEPEDESEAVPAGTNPLTGMPMEPEYENNRPVAVMFNNLKAAQPQLGVSQADIIYEVPAEGGITRMLGLFQTLDGVGNLGSIRSTRAYYLELALGHDALLVHAGGSPEAYRDIPAWGVNNIDGVNGGPSQDAVFWRDAERRKNAGYEHSMLTSGEKVQAYLDKGKYRTEHQDGYTYAQAFAADGTPTGGQRAEQISIAFTSYKTGTFTYDASTGLYMIGQYGKDYIDGNTGEQVGVTNVLILETAISEIAGDSAGRLTVKMTGEGKGTYFCGGKSIPITWSKADRNSQFVYRLQDGTPLTLGSGKSYVCIISPKQSTVTIQ